MTKKTEGAIVVCASKKGGSMVTCTSILHNCLYFTANSLARIITRMADEEFRKTGLSPSHAILMMLVIDSPGIYQKAICEELHLAPSTVTRFIDVLVHKGFIVRKSKGKISAIFPTDTGRELRPIILEAWKKFHQRYTRILGLQEGDDLTRMIDAAAFKLESRT